MRTRQIAPGQWRQFIEDFGRLHAGAIVTLDLQAPDGGPSATIAGRPLRAIRPGVQEVVIHLGDIARGDREVHLPSLSGVSIEQTDEGADTALDFAGAGGAHAQVRLRWPVLPELLDPAVE